MQAVSNFGSKVINFFAAIDRKAEDIGAFPKLEQAEIPGEIRNRDGSISDQVDDVCSHCHHFSSAF